MMKGQSAKCDEGPIRIIAENFRHFDEAGHSYCAKFFIFFLLINSVTFCIVSTLLALHFWDSVAFCDVCLETWWCSNRAYGSWPCLTINVGLIMFVIFLVTHTWHMVSVEGDVRRLQCIVYELP
jgi:hypothetical protein